MKLTIFATFCLVSFSKPDTGGRTLTRLGNIVKIKKQISELKEVNVDSK